MAAWRDETTERLLALVDENAAKERARREREESGTLRYWIARAQAAQARRLGYRDAERRYGA